jgi:hypothetical protein
MQEQHPHLGRGQARGREAPATRRTLARRAGAQGRRSDRDELDLFKKNLQSFVRAYEFLSQIVVYDDPELEQLCVYARTCTRCCGWTAWTRTSTSPNWS